MDHFSDTDLAVEQTEPTMRWSDGYHFGEALVRRGFERIGSGDFSAVYAKANSDRVIKVNRTPDNWLDYVVWATKAGFAGGFAPKVYSYRYIDGYDATFYVAVVELLDDEIANIDHQRPDLFRECSLLSDYMRGYNGVTSDMLHPDSARFGDELRANISGPLDLHFRNWMVRADGTICLIDPITERASSLDGLSAPPRMRSSDMASISATIPPRERSTDSRHSEAWDAAFNARAFELDHAW